jgi:methylenetetrahydrofolate reductase (NADPH)
MNPPSFSFEFFPPKTAEGIEKLRETRKELAQFDPEFFSVTFGAGGSTRDRTMETVLEIQREGFQAAPHISVSHPVKPRFATCCKPIRHMALTVW